MKKEIWLLRHGKAKRDAHYQDFDRPLKKWGQQAAGLVGEWLKQEGLTPDLVLSSPAKRAHDTAKLAVAALESHHQIQLDKRLYFEGMDAIKAVIAEHGSSAEQLLIVGHNPDFEDLLIHWVGAAQIPLGEKLLPTAALARISFTSDGQNLDAGSGQLVSLIYAKSLAHSKQNDKD